METAGRTAIWPLFLYGALMVIAVAAPRRKRRDIRESLGPSRPQLEADSDKRPREQFENDQPIVEQVRRGKEKGRGRRAAAPWEIPWKGWKDIFWRVYASVGDNRLLAVAAGVVFYSILAIFPAVAG